MKSKLILGSLLALSVSVKAQNLFPSPSGRVYVNSNGIITGARNALEIYSTNPGDNVGIGGSAPGISLYGGTAVPPGAPGTPFSTPYAKIALATAPGHYLANALAGDFVIQNVGMTQAPFTGNGKSIIFSSRFEGGNGVEHMRINENGDVGVGTSNLNNTKLSVDKFFNPPAGTGAIFWGTKSTYRSQFSPQSGIIDYLVGIEGAVTSLNNTSSFATGVVGRGSGGWQNIGGDFYATGSGVLPNIAVRGYANGGGSNFGGWFDGATYCTSGTWSGSDRKLKENVKHLSGTLDKIMLLNPCSYTFKKDAEYKDMQLPTNNQMGLIAQELEEVFPDLVMDMPSSTRFNEKGEKTITTPGFKAVQYTSLIPVLIAGIQEQQQIIKTQQKQLDDQKAMIEQLAQKSTNTTGLNTINTIETGFQMSQNEPNPFTHETIVKYTLPQTISNAFMAVYDLTGKQITTFPITEKGASSITITSEKLAAGIYIYSIVADGKVVDSKRMIVAEK